MWRYVSAVFGLYAVDVLYLLVVNYLLFLSLLLMDGLKGNGAQNSIGILFIKEVLRLW